jgi:hypothetical protein
MKLDIHATSRLEVAPLVGFQRQNIHRHRMPSAPGSSPRALDVARRQSLAENS